MTRAEFVARAVRTAERDLRVPAGWWGTWRDLHAPSGARVRHGGNVWTVRDRSGRVVSKHDSRRVAIRKAAGL